MAIYEEKYIQFLSGDISSFEEIVLHYKDNLIYFIRKYVSSLEACEDISQDVFVEVYVHKERYNFKVSLKTYLFSIAKNKAIDYLRHHNVEEKYQSDLYSDKDYESLEEKVIKEEKQKVLIDALNKLPDKYKRVIYLAYYEDFSYQEIAKVVGVTLPQVKITIHRAKKMLKEILEKEGYHEDR